MGKYIEKFFRINKLHDKIVSLSIKILVKQTRLHRALSAKDKRQHYKK